VESVKRKHCVKKVEHEPTDRLIEQDGEKGTDWPTWDFNSWYKKVEPSDFITKINSTIVKQISLVDCCGHQKTFYLELLETSIKL